jgi:hypothetical protein
MLSLVNVRRRRVQCAHAPANVAGRVGGTVGDIDPLIAGCHHHKRICSSSSSRNNALRRACSCVKRSALQTQQKIEVIGMVTISCHCCPQA